MPSATVHKLVHAVIDAGSSGTRLFLYEVERGPYPHVRLIAQIENPIMPNGEKEDGINNFVGSNHSHGAMNVVPLIIIPLLDKIKPLITSYNLTSHDVTVDLFGTAGMRYAEKMFGLDAIDEFYEQIRQGVLGAGFIAGEVRTSDGQREEGVWTWINLNDLERDIFRTENIPLGVVEVGGSSAQLSYPILNSVKDILNMVNPPSSIVVSINGRTHQVYSISYLGLGQDDARKAMRIRLGDSSSWCFPKGFSAAKDAGDILDGVGHYRLTSDGDYQFDRCNQSYEDLIIQATLENAFPDLGTMGIDFVGTDAIYHATKYWEIEDNPTQLSSMILSKCLDLSMFPGIELNESIQSQAANATYVQALLYGSSGLFKNNPSALVRALPNRVNGAMRLSWTRGFLLQKYAQP